MERQEVRNRYGRKSLAQCKLCWWMGVAWKVINGGWQKENNSQEIPAPEKEDHSWLLTLAGVLARSPQRIPHTYILSIPGNVEIRLILVQIQFFHLLAVWHWVIFFQFLLLKTWAKICIKESLWYLNLTFVRIQKFQNFYSFSLH